MDQPLTGMNAYTLLESAWYDLRADSSSDYGAREGMVLIQRACKHLTLDLARRKSPLVAEEVQSGGTDWTYKLASGRVQIPDDFVSLYDLFVDGLTSLGPLTIMPATSRFEQAAATPGYYRLTKQYMNILPAPADETTIYLRYAAWPAIVSTALAATDDAAIAALSGLQMPFRGLFDEVVRQFVVISFANRNEYDTKVEQGLYQMLKSEAMEVAGREALNIEDMAVGYPSGDNLWSGRS